VSRPALLRAGRVVRHHQRVADDEATQLLLEAVFDIKAAVYEIHDVGVWRDEDEDGEEEEEEDS
jgi:hypothetical protein